VNESLPGELRDDPPVTVGIVEAVVLLSREAGERVKDVRRWPLSMVRLSDLNTSFGRCVFITGRPNTFDAKARSLGPCFDRPLVDDSEYPFDEATASGRVALADMD
jgi:hypothetical protein